MGTDEIFKSGRRKLEIFIKSIPFDNDGQGHKGEEKKKQKDDSGQPFDNYHPTHNDTFTVQVSSFINLIGKIRKCKFYSVILN